MRNKSGPFYLFVDRKAVRVPEDVFRDYKRFERKERYFSYDLKHERVIHERETQTVIVVPAREISLERLLESGYQFSAAEEDPLEDYHNRMEMLELLAEAMELLAPEERDLILELYYRGRTERDVGAEKNLSKSTIHSKKESVLQKMREFVERFI